MKRLCLMICFGVLILTLSTAPLLGQAPTGNIVIAQGSTVKALALADRSPLWTNDAGFAITSVHVVPDGQRSVILGSGSSGTAAFDGATGTQLWSLSPGFPSVTEYMRRDVYGQLCTDVIRYPYGLPNIGGSFAPDVLLVSSGDSSFTTHLADSRTGEIIWSRTEYSAYPGIRGEQFYPTSSGSYDVIFSSGPFFTSTGGRMFRVDGATGSTVIWERDFANRSGIPVPDITGDGEYEFFAEPSAWSSTVLMLDGATGDTVWSTGYGSFDVIGIPQVVARGDGGYDVIVSAQLASAGGIRRYRTEDGSVVWDSSHTYNNNLIIGLLKRTDGLTVLSGWRHQGKAVALDAATGQVLWDNIPSNAELVGIGVPDMTGDGSDDFLALNNGWLRLYDGVTGVEQTWFAPIQADWVAYYAIGEVETDPPIADAGDDIIASANEEITLDASDSNDPDGEIILYTWKRLPGDVVIYSGEEPTCQTWALGRVEEVIELTVTDNYWATATDTVRIVSRTTQDLQDQVSEMQSQIEELQRQIQELQALVDKIASRPPVRKWLEKSTDGKD